jgi:hypothetical protein
MNRLPTKKNQEVKVLVSTTAPDYSSNALTEVTLPRDTNGDGTDDDFTQKVMIPNNSIWFKPKKEGQRIISFSIGDKGENYRYRSIYRFRRENGNIVDWTETRLAFAKDLFSNKDLVVFPYEITKGDVDKNYEFIIGAPSKGKGTGIHFYFLALAGANETGGDDDEEEGTV